MGKKKRKKYVQLDMFTIQAPEIRALREHILKPKKNGK